MIQVAGFDLLFGWIEFIALLIVLGSFVLRTRADVFEETSRRTSEQPESDDDVDEKLRDGDLRTDPRKK
jgi:hypothetical protein